MARRTISFRLPEELEALVEAKQSVMGESSATAVIELLRSAIPSLPLGEKRNLPTRSAIYLVHTPQKLLYIGRAKDLRKRFQQHHRMSQFLEYGGDVRISWFECAENEAPDLEETLVEGLNPEMNGEPVTGEKLVTFRVDEEFWLAFKQRAAETGMNATTAFMELGQMYVSGHIDLNAATRPAMQKILDELSQLRERMSALESTSPKFPSPLGGKRA